MCCVFARCIVHASFSATSCNNATSCKKCMHDGVRCIGEMNATCAMHDCMMCRGVLRPVPLVRKEPVCANQKVS